MGWPVVSVADSPPHARRGLRGKLRHRQVERVTSACAERTTDSTSCTGLTTAHLRARGEDHAPFVASAAVSGSPPLARRAHMAVRADRDRVRLTSACADRTSAASPRAMSPTAHLRTRGEYVCRTDRHHCHVGLPRLAQRARRPQCHRGPNHRFTSARAERTCGRATSSTTKSAHLRSRGEDTKMGWPVVSVAGSPPLARRGPRHRG